VLNISSHSYITLPEIKGELKKKDDEFVKTLKRQAEDIDTLLQYMSRQFVEMQGAYKEELEEIEGAFLQVRDADQDDMGEIEKSGRGGRGEGV
jgi:dynein regulatory complex protein 1